MRHVSGKIDGVSGMKTKRSR